MTNDMISQVWGKEKVLEARNTLTVAYPEDYAMLQGCGGQDHARTSGIYTCITDISQSAKQKNNGTSPTVGATVPTSVFIKAKAVAEYNLGDIVLDEGAVAASIGDIGMIGNLLYFLFCAVFAVVQSIGLTAGNFLTGKMSVKDLPQAVLDTAKAARDTMNKANPNRAAGRIPIPVYKDWDYSQTRVNSYKQFNDGTVAVTVLNISRKQYQDMGNGQPAQKQEKPWTVHVSKFRARPQVQQNGTVSYQYNTKCDETVARIKLSDDQMFDFCHRIEHFENLWEITECGNLVHNGVMAKLAGNSGNY